MLDSKEVILSPISFSFAQKQKKVFILDSCINVAPSQTYRRLVKVEINLCSLLQNVGHPQYFPSSIGGIEESCWMGCARVLKIFKNIYLVQKILCVCCLFGEASDCLNKYLISLFSILVIFRAPSFPTTNLLNSEPQ